MSAKEVHGESAWLVSTEDFSLVVLSIVDAAVVFNLESMRFLIYLHDGV